MKKSIIKIFAFILVITIGFSAIIPTALAYVSVRGYYRSNGTYVSPYIRSSPNSLRYDNYGYRGGSLYNSSYYGSTRNYSSSWYTPSWSTDSSYYYGKSLYNSSYSYPSYSYPSLYNWSW